MINIRIMITKHIYKLYIDHTPIGSHLENLIENGLSLYKHCLMCGSHESRGLSDYSIEQSICNLHYMYIEFVPFKTKTKRKDDDGDVDNDDIDDEWGLHYTFIMY